MRTVSSLLLSTHIVQALGFLSSDIGIHRTHVNYLSMVEKGIEDLHLTPQLKTMTKALGSIPDEKTRYKQLLFMANKLEPMDPHLMVAENKVPGCLSTVYIDYHAETRTNANGEEETILNFVGDSDGLLTKGLVALLVRGLSGSTPDEIQRVDPEFITAAKISQSLTPGRNNGFLNMLAVMKKKAADANAVDSFLESENNPSSTEEVIVSFDEIDDKPMYNAMMSSLLKLKPTKLVLKDDSDQHAGHAGSKGWEDSGESHFSLEIVASVFFNLPLVKRHQLIYIILGDIMDKIHALQITARTPEEE